MISWRFPTPVRIQTLCIEYIMRSAVGSPSHPGSSIYALIKGHGGYPKKYYLVKNNGKASDNHTFAPRNQFSHKPNPSKSKLPPYFIFILEGWMFMACPDSNYLKFWKILG